MKNDGIQISLSLSGLGALFEFASRRYAANVSVKTLKPIGLSFHGILPLIPLFYLFDHSLPCLVVILFILLARFTPDDLLDFLHIQTADQS